MTCLNDLHLLIHLAHSYLFLFLHSNIIFLLEVFPDVFFLSTSSSWDPDAPSMLMLIFYCFKHLLSSFKCVISPARVCVFVLKYILPNASLLYKSFKIIIEKIEYSVKMENNNSWQD